MKKLFPLLFVVILFLFLEFPGKQAASQIKDQQPAALSFWHVGKLDVSVSNKQFADEEELRDILLAQLKKRRGPDVFTFPLRDLSLYLPYLLPTAVSGHERMWNFASERLIQKKSLYGLPLSAKALMMIYHNRYYQHGIRPAWHDFAEQTRSISIPGIAMGILDHVKNGWPTLEALFIQKGITLSGKPKNAWFDTLELFTRFSDEQNSLFNWNERLSKNFSEMELQSFVQGQVAAIFGYPEDYQRMLEKVQTENVRISKNAISLALFPQFDPKNAKYLADATVLGISIFSHSPKEAWEFARSLTDLEHATAYESLTGLASGRPIPWRLGESELARIQKAELSSAQSFDLSKKAKERVESILMKAMKNRAELREILNDSL